MSKSLLSFAGILFFANMAVAQSSVSSTTNTTAAPGATGCEVKAVSKNGKPLAGAAKNAFMKKCEASAASGDKAVACAAKAVDKNGKPLAGASKSSFMKKCEATN
ncbi:hypothetical protein NX784_22515 [Massilia pinisoli]|uniref:PsiF repeat-containing protein n=1 Tax=Massilia pinisoli TaxID=1772194 RepID=A0ABT1ZWW2_9BURK|nr:hypothetical protein [Massilia pinisoli]MCS0584369.1 hypothetical protein [Massilia pinisoli]